MKGWKFQERLATVFARRYGASRDPIYFVFEGERFEVGDMEDTGYEIHIHLKEVVVNGTLHGPSRSPVERLRHPDELSRAQVTDSNLPQAGLRSDWIPDQ